METGIFEVKLNDGGLFRVLYENKSQKQRIILALKNNVEKIHDWNVVLNGIHNVKDFESIIKNR